MASYNKVQLIGNLTRDPETRFTGKGTAVGEIGLAINRAYKGENGDKKEEVTFVDVTLWGKTAELAQQYLGKGSSVLVEGRLEMESWEDKATGQKRSKLKVVGELLQFLSSKKDIGNSPQSAAKSGGQRYDPMSRAADDDDFDSVPF